MSTGRYIAVLTLAAALAFAASAAWARGPGETPPEGTTPTGTGPTTTTPPPTTTEPTPPPTETTPPATTPAPAPTTGGAGCFISSAGLICPGNPGCVVTSAGVTCAQNCAITSAGLVCPRGAVLGNPPVRRGKRQRKARHERKGTFTQKRASTTPASALKPATIPIDQPTGGGELPFTGEPLLPVFGLGLALLAAGLLLLRRGRPTPEPAVSSVKEAAPPAGLTGTGERSSRPPLVVRSLALAAVLLLYRSRR